MFLGFRPWLLLAAAALASRFGWRTRLAFYASALMLAAISESLLLLGLGASNPWPEAGRGLAAGAVVAFIIDLLIQLGIRFGRRYGRSLATGAVALLFVAGALAPYEAAVIGRDQSPSATKSDLMVISALPLRWSEQGPLDPDGRPAAAYGALGEEFSIRFLDRLDRPVLSSGRLLLVAQPRALDPAELVALDQWVRAGGRALILTDPMLAWPSDLALGDIRRPPAIGLLDPLLSHWGLSLAGDPEPRLVTRHIEAGGALRRLVMFGPGRFAAEGDACKVGRTREIARCRLGRGEALLLGDADMMHDRLWVGPGSRGAERHARRSDNPLLIADWLDALAGNRRPRRAGPVEWLDPASDRPIAVLLTLLPLVALAAPALILRIRRR